LNRQTETVEKARLFPAIWYELLSYEQAARGLRVLRFWNEMVLE
jgi:hypothetical protein